MSLATANRRLLKMDQTSEWILVVGPSPGSFAQSHRARVVVSLRARRSAFAWTPLVPFVSTRALPRGSPRTRVSRAPQRRAPPSPGAREGARFPTSAAKPLRGVHELSPLHAR